MRWRALLCALATVLVLTEVVTADVLWRDNDDRPVAEPAEDAGADYLWWDGIWSMSYYQFRKVLDLGVSLHTVGETVGLVGPREAANLNALDEVPDSTWFTNRHARRRLSTAELRRGAHAGQPPSPNGRYVVLSGKSYGMTSGFVMKDEKGDRYIVKFDPPGFPDVPTGAEIVCSKILHALGWNVPDYYLIRFDPRRLDIDPEAHRKDRYNRKVPFTRKDLESLLEYGGKLPDGRMRAVASLFIAGKPKGGFRTLGLRHDDANDTVPHEDRRDLRGLRTVAAWINFTDARRGNFYDTFVAEEGSEGGHLVHYLLDFSSALGSGNDDWKDRWYGHEYYLEPKKVLRLLSFGLIAPGWSTVPPSHRSLGYYEAEHFDPEQWRTSYANPLFDAATLRDSFWGAKLVHSFTAEDIDAVAKTGQWSDADAPKVLADVLRGRQKKIAAAYFAAARINPIDGFEADAEHLRYRDLAVESGAVSSEAALYRHREPSGQWQQNREPAAPAAPVLELQTSHDGGRHWSPTTRVTLEDVEVVRIERDTR